MFTDADTFSLDFPANMNLNERMIVFGAVFLIDFMFFEDDKSGKGSTTRVSAIS